jgi:phosphoenolpyruvate carboxykinase (ATP)
LINTGWTGGSFGIGHRMKLSHTRSMITAALEGKLDNIETTTDPVFGYDVPVSCPGVPSEVLNARNTWADKEAYDKMAHFLADLYKKNFEKYAAGVAEEIKAAGPKI